MGYSSRAAFCDGVGPVNYTKTVLGPAKPPYDDIRYSNREGFQEKSSPGAFRVLEDGVYTPFATTGQAI